MPKRITSSRLWLWDFRVMKQLHTVVPFNMISVYKLQWMSNGRFTHNMPCPCRSPAMPCRQGFRMSFPFDLHCAAVSDSHLPCRAHAIPDHSILLKATAQHGRRERACGLTAHVRLLPAITRSSRCYYQTHTNLRCR